MNLDDMLPENMAFFISLRKFLFEAFSCFFVKSECNGDSTEVTETEKNE
jgi:hypothetical protein